MSGKKDRTAWNAIGSTAKSVKKKISKAIKRRSKPGGQSQKGRSRSRRG